MEQNIDYKQLFFAQRQSAERMFEIFKVEYEKQDRKYQQLWQELREAQCTISELKVCNAVLEAKLAERIIIRFN